MVKIGHTKGFMRQLHALSLGLLLMIGGIALFATGLDRVQAEHSMGGPVVHMAPVESDFLMGSGDRVLLVGDEMIDVYGPDGQSVGRLEAPSELRSFFLENPAMIDGTHAVVQEGVLDLERGGFMAVDWPEGFTPRAVSWPYVYGVNATHAVRLGFGDEGTLATNTVSWQGEEDILWNQSRFVSASKEKVVVAAAVPQDLPWPRTSWLIWDSSNATIQQVPLPPNERLATAQYIFPMAPVSFTEDGLLILSNSSSSGILRMYDWTMDEKWRVDLEGEIFYSSVSVSEKLWVVNVMMGESSGYAFGLFYGDLSGNKLGERWSSGSLFINGYSYGQPLQDMIVIVERSRLTFTSPFEGTTTSSHLLMFGGGALIVAGVALPTARAWYISKGQRRRSKCPECGSPLEASAIVWCRDCGHRP